MLKNEFSWSKSRQDAFNDCPRKYYWHYYGSWNGWERDADSLTKEAYRLKHLKKWQIWTGECVHDSIDYLLKQTAEGNAPSEGSLIYNAKIKMTADFKTSKHGLCLNRSPKHYLRLLEHEYNKEISLELPLERAEICLDNFYKTGFIEKTKQLPKENIIKLEKFDSFNFEGTKVFCTPDYVFKTYPDEELVIAEWKTGKQKELHEFQLACYGLFALEKWDVQKMQLDAYYLLENKTTTKNIEASEFEETKARIRENIKGLESLLKDKEKNIPLDIEKFYKIGSEKTCNSCNFQKICCSDER